FVCERTGLAQLRIRTNGDVLVDQAGVECDLRCSSARNFLIMTEKRAGDAQQVALHVELVGAGYVICSENVNSCIAHIEVNQLYPSDGADERCACGQRHCDIDCSSM